jgi:hypothetical protein
LIDASTRTVYSHRRRPAFRGVDGLIKIDWQGNL